MPGGVDLAAASEKDGSAPASFTGLASGLRNHGGLNIQKADNERPDKEIILAVGDKEAGKSSAFVDLPRPNDGKTVFLSFDTRTRIGIIERFGEVPDHIDIYELAVPSGDYEGYDASDTSTAELVVGTAAALLEQFKNDGGVDNIVLDHYQRFYEEILTMFAKHKNGLDATVARLQPQHWRPRTDAANIIFSKAFAACNARLVLTGYSKEENEKMVSRQVPDGKGGTRTEWTKEMVEPRWVKQHKRDVHFWFHMKRGKTGRGADGLEEAEYDRDFFLEVVTSSNEARFPPGRVFRMNDKTISVFFDDEQEEPKEVEPAD